MSRLLISAVGVLCLSSAALGQVEIKYAPEVGTVLRRNFEVKHFLAVKRSVTKMGDLEEVGQRTFDIRNVETMQTSDRIFAVTANHTVWFHRPVRFDDWVLYSTNSPVAAESRGLGTGHFIDRSGQLLATVVQEGIVKYFPGRS